MQHNRQKIGYNTSVLEGYEMNNVHCIYMGTPKIAATVLENMIKHGIQVDLVVTQPDKKVGRKQNIVYSPVKQVALNYDIPVFQPIKIKEDHQMILDQNPDLIVTCAYGQFIPKHILDTPTFGCVNLHGSLLPKYRGGAPIQRAIWNGDTLSGMSLMKMIPKMDAGPVFSTQEITIESTDTSSSLFEKMAFAASDLIIKHYDDICSKDAKYQSQDESQATFAPVILKEEEHINLQQEDNMIMNQIRALSSQPGAYVRVKNKKLKILKARYRIKSIDQPFTLIGWNENGYCLNLRKGILIMDEVQMEGKPIMTSKDFYNGQGRNLVGQIVE